MTDQPQRPVGQRYSLVYMDRPMSIRDSERLRRRLLIAFQDCGFDKAGALHREVERKIGVPVPTGYGGYVGWPRFFEDCAVDVLLDTITIAAGHLPSLISKWRPAVEVILREEQTAYTVDEKCGVHPYVDAQFQRIRLDAIAALRDERYAGASLSVVKAYDALHGSPIQARDAIKHMFEANESLFRLLASRAPRLGASEARTHLQPIIDRQYDSDPVAKRSMQQMLASFSDWVDAAHHYRHAPGEGQPTEPPEEVWQLLMSQGGGFARWLSQLARATDVSG